MADVRVFPDLDALSRAAADLFAQTVEGCAGEGRPACIAVSGGSTPKRLFQILASDPRRARVRWDSVRLFQVDERPVPPDDEESNYRLLRENLLESVPLPPESVFRVDTEIGPPSEAAEDYQRRLESVLPRTDDNWPRFDLIYLGMGDDGHTASLFPGSPGLHERSRWVIANPVQKLGVERITLTYPVINHAAEIAFLVSGAGKADILKRVLTGPKEIEELPSQGIDPVNGVLHWLVDEAAYGGLRYEG